MWNRGLSSIAPLLCKTKSHISCYGITNKRKDSNANVEKHRVIVPGLPAAHALSGCDTVACYVTLGK